MKRKSKNNNSLPLPIENTNLTLIPEDHEEPDVNSAVSTVLPRVFTLDDPIDALWLPTRLENSLKNWEIKTVRQLYEFPEQYLKNIRNIGPKTLKQLLEVRGEIRERLKISENAQRIVSNEETADSREVPETTEVYKYLASSIDKIYLPPRLVAILKEKGVYTIGQFYKFRRKKLRKIKGVGPMGLLLIWRAKRKIEDIMKSKSETDSSTIHSVNGVVTTIPEPVKAEEVVPKSELLDLLLSRCKEDRLKDVILRRYGLINGEKQTLEEIGRDYKVTRERIRQLQVKALRWVTHPSTRAKHPIIEVIEDVLYQKGGIISGEEADVLVPQAFENNKFDGSSFLDLVSDLRWMQRFDLDDITFYSPKVGEMSLSRISEEIIKVVSKEDSISSAQDIADQVNNFKGITEERFVPVNFVTRYCYLDPRIEESGSNYGYSNDYENGLEVQRLFRYYQTGHKTKAWIALIKRVFDIERTPLHFTEVADKVNDLILEHGQKLEVRRAHSIMIDSKIFAHTGVRGTYGLIEWGIRKETTPELVEECLNKAGFPLHWSQIYNYVSKYKNTKPMNIRSVLDFNIKFEKKGNGVYGLKPN